MADVRERGLIQQPDADRIGRLARRASRTARIQAVVSQVIRFAGVEYEMDRIDGDDRRQQR